MLCLTSEIAATTCVLHDVLIKMQSKKFLHHEGQLDLNHHTSKIKTIQMTVPEFQPGNLLELLQQTESIKDYKSFISIRLMNSGGNIALSQGFFCLQGRHLMFFNGCFITFLVECYEPCRDPVAVSQMSLMKLNEGGP